MLKQIGAQLGLGILLATTSFISRAPAQTAAADDSSPPAIVQTETLPPVILDQAQNQQTIQTTTLLTDARGVVTTNVSSYVELASGMNRLDDQGRWQPAVAQFELLDGNAVARRTAFRVILAPSPTDANPVDVLFPDGARFSNRCLGLGWFDAATGKSVLFAEPRAVAGVLAPDGTEVTYPDCFDSVSADLRYRLKISGLEADVILFSQVPAPQTFGLNPDTCRLEVITEFLQAPPATLDPRVLSVETDPAARAQMAEPDFVDSTIDFGAMLMPPGVAVSLAKTSPEEMEDALPVAKHLETVGGRTFLFEDVRWHELAPLLQDLPAPPQASLAPTNGTRVAAARSRGRESALNESGKDQRRLTSAATAGNGSTGGSPVPASDSLAAAPGAGARVLARPDLQVGRIVPDEPDKFPPAHEPEGRARHSVRAVPPLTTSWRRARSDTPYPASRDSRAPAAQNVSGKSLLGEREGVRANQTLKQAGSTRVPRVAAGVAPATAFTIAKELRPARGVLLDWNLVLTTTNMWFAGSITYFVTNSVILSGTTRFEPGTVIKFETNSASFNARLELTGPITNLARPYLPVFFTARDDNSLGETVTGSLGAPVPGGYALAGLRISTGSAVDLANFRFSFLRIALDFNSSAAHTLSHAQFVSNTWPIRLFNAAGANVTVRNALIAGTVDSVFRVPNLPASLTGEHLTIHNSPNFWFAPNGAPTIKLTNSLVIGVATNSTGFTGAGNVFSAPDVPALFQTLGAGAHYLAANSTNRNAGVTNLTASLLADFKTRTTYPPQELTSDFVVDTVLAPNSAFPDNDNLPDRGYHYDVLDYAWGNRLVTNNVTLLLTNGVSVGLYGATTTVLRAQARFLSEGTPLAPNRLTRFHSVQEQPASSWHATNVTQSLLGLNTSSGAPQTVVLRFTEVPLVNSSSLGPRSQLFLVKGGLAGALTLRDCRLHNVFFDVAQLSGSGLLVGLTNNLWHRCVLSSSLKNPII